MGTTQGTSARVRGFDHGLHIQRVKAHWKSQTQSTHPSEGKDTDEEDATDYTK